jgi:hypothetical protein
MPRSAYLKGYVALKRAVLASQRLKVRAGIVSGS